ncbi:DUF4321 domain-containing protein [Cohnella fermenti]|uniref:DUF4321 domain-containing protein n=1 Tax=Cohnella fermenti TaxID=2565925 RepID=A0A4S4C820_9BACL|nr:DUF4321 domain-containing protein [Cohnella fermenti]THF83794.1 DUF4321 domain-containing protein [Cohnella fermenti]
MKKSAWVLVLLVFIGLLAGAMVARWLDDVPGLDFLTRSFKIDWSPSADLLVLNYTIHIGLDISLLSIIGAIAAIWAYRRM